MKLKVACLVGALVLTCPIAANAFLFSYGSSSSAPGAHAHLIAQLVKEFRLDHPQTQIEVRGANSYVAPVVETFMYEGSVGVPEVAVVGIPDSPMLLEKSRLNSLATFLSADDIREIRQALRKELDNQYYGPTTDAHDYFLPFNRSNLVLYVNTSLLDPSKKAEASWTELAGQLEKQRQATPGLRSRLTMTLPLYDWNIEPMLVSVRGSPTIEHDQVHLDDAASAEVIAAVTKLKRSGAMQLVLSQGRAFLDFTQGLTAAALLSMSTYSSVAESVKFPFRVLMPPPLKKKVAIIGGGDLLFPKNAAVKMTPQTIKDVRTFVRWFYLERGAALWARLVGYHPVTTAAYKSPLFKEFVATHPADRDVLLNTGHWEGQSFYRLDRYCNVVQLHKSFDDGLKEIFDADDQGPVIARVQATLTALVRKPCP